MFLPRLTPICCTGARTSPGPRAPALSIATSFTRSISLPSSARRRTKATGYPSPTVEWTDLGEVGTAQKRGMLCQEPHASAKSLSASAACSLAREGGGGAFDFAAAAPLLHNPGGNIAQQLVATYLPGPLGFRAAHRRSSPSVAFDHEGNGGITHHGGKIFHERAG